MRKSFIILAFLLLLSAVPLGAQETPICLQNEQYYRRWELLLNAQLPLGNAWNFTEITVSPNGEVLAVARGNIVAIHDAETLSETSQLEIGAEGYVRPLFMGWSPDSQFLAVAHDGYASDRSRLDGLQLWNVGQNQLLNRFAFSSITLAWSPQTSILATVDSDRNIWFWDIFRGMSFLFREKNPDNIPVSSILEWSPDGQHLAAATTAAYSALEIYTFGTRVPQVIESPIDFISTASWSADSAQIAIGNPVNSRIHLFDITTSELIRTLRGSTGRPFDVQWSPDGRIIARATSTGFFLWDLSSDDDQPSRSFVEDVPPFMRMEWSPDSQYVYSVDLDGSVYKWDIESGCMVAAALTDWSTISWLN